MELANATEAIASATAETRNILDHHKHKWQGISMSVDEAMQTLRLVKGAGGQPALSKLFNKSMEKFGEQLLLFVHGVDKYMFWLSNTDFFPDTFDVHSIIGVEAYNTFKAEQGRQMKPACTPNEVYSFSDKGGGF